MKRPEIISLGEVLWDLFPDGERFGGAPANFACHAAIAGADVTMVSAVGDDRHGREAVGILGDYGIDVSLMQIVPDVPTGTVGVALDSRGKPTFTIHEGSAWDRLDLSAQLAATARSVDAVYFGTLGQRSELSRQSIRRCVEAARDTGVPRIVDINLRAPFFDKELIRESVELASVLKLSEEELAYVADAFEISPADDKKTLRKFLDRSSLDLVVMTRGADGAILVSQDETVDQPGIPAEVRDTVGAGDAFTATLVLGCLQGEAYVSLIRKACENAAKVCSISGAVPPAPKAL